MFNGGTLPGGTATADYFRGAVTPDLTGRVRHTIIVDWDGNGHFSSLYSDVSADAIGDVQTERGNDLETQLTKAPQAGSFSCTLRNYHGRYSTYKATSPLFEASRPGLRIMAWALTPYAGRLFTGLIDSINPLSANESPTGEPIAVLRASGVFKQDLGDQATKITAGPLDGELPGTVLEAILDEAGVTASRRIIALGSVPLANWWKEEADAFDSIKEVVEHDFGNYFEGLNFDHVYEGRYDRLGKASLATFSATPAGATPPDGLSQQDSIRLVYNRAVMTVRPFDAAPAAVAVLWEASSNEPHYLAPGDEVSFTARYSDGYVETWTTPAVSTDVVGDGGTLSVSNVIKRAQSMTFTVANTHVSDAANLTTIQARGLARAALTEFTQSEEDAASQVKYRKRTFTGSPYYSTANYAKDSAAFVVLVSKDPHPILELSIPSSSSAAYSQLAATLDIGDRVTVEADDLLTQFGIDSDFFIERIKHSFGAGLPWRTTYTLSPAFAELYDLAIWQLGVAGFSELGDTTALGY